MAEKVILIINLIREERNQRRLRIARVFRDRSNPFEEFSDAEFIQRMRLTKTSAFYVFQQILSNITAPTKRSVVEFYTGYKIGSKNF